MPSRTYWLAACWGRITKITLPLMIGLRADVAGVRETFGVHRY